MSVLLSFIESQFPVSKVSKESYKERMANMGQTLTGLGKWWGRKPLVLVRATILGLLMPASSNPKRDREIFLKIMSMDDEGLLLRKEKNLSVKELYEYATDEERLHHFKTDGDNLRESKISWNPEISREERDEFQNKIFNRLSYDQKLLYCKRPEQLENLRKTDWEEINTHLNTNAGNLNALVEQLGQKQFGHTPRVGDAFCGGGSIPFEAARIGCEAYGSDLNPVAALLTWAGLNIIGGGEKVVEEVKRAQQEVYEAVDSQITEWGIEHNEQGWRADVYLYCVEARDPVSGYMVPLAPNWIIGEKTRCIAKLHKNDAEKKFNIEILSGVSDAEMKAARESGTVKDSYLINPADPNARTAISTLRGDNRIKGENVFGLRLWENEDLMPRPDDVFQERLYCVRYVETYYEVIKEITTSNLIKGGGDESFPKGKQLTKKVALSLSNFPLLIEKGYLKEKTRKHYVAPLKNDLQREEKTITLLKEKFHDWQEKGFIPSRKIERGDKTDEPIRTRGWSYWHQLFNPRQLLTNGLYSLKLSSIPDKKIKIGLVLGLGKILDWNSKLSVWDSSSANERVANTFLNQALNPLLKYGCRPFTATSNSWFYDLQSRPIPSLKEQISVSDARIVNQSNDFWITDPPYADAVYYHELSDFFLAWYERHIKSVFQNWYLDNKKALAIKGAGEDFRKSMVETYSNLNNKMSENGAQIVMFTHQDASVWADLALILWASGLQVTAAWTIATETDSALKAGNYVQGTVLLILRKQTSQDETFLNDVYPEVETEVIRQLQSMMELEDKEDPNFGDSDYQLAAYAAALRVLTHYKKIHPIDVNYELSKPRKKGEKNEVEKLIDKAVEIATNYLVPEGFDKELWITLTPEEKFYLKGMEVQTHGEYRNGVYQEFARGFGLKEYKYLLSTGKANETRLRSALEFKNKNLRDEGFGKTMLRQILFALHETSEKEDPRVGLQYLKDEIPDYWPNRQRLITISRYLNRLGKRIEHWHSDAVAAELLTGALENDRI